MDNPATSNIPVGDPLVRELVVSNEYGLHARPAALLVQTASRFEADVRLMKDGQFVSAKSIISVLTLEAQSGCIVELHIQGPDASDAMDALCALFESRFNEEPD